MPQATFALVNSAQVAVFEAKRRAGSRARATHSAQPFMGVRVITCGTQLIGKRCAFFDAQRTKLVGYIKLQITQR